jgi:hypothetical protein
VLKGEGCHGPQTAYLSRIMVPKMDGAKRTADTIGHRKVVDRWAYCLSRSFSVRDRGSSSNENPGGSRT